MLKTFLLISLKKRTKDGNNPEGKNLKSAEIIFAK